MGLIVAGLGVSLVAGVAFAQGPIGVTLARGEGPEVRIRVEFVGETDGDTQVGLAADWGGFEGAGDEVHGLAATGERADALEVVRDSGFMWSVRHAPGERVEVEYTLRPEDRARLQPGRNDYRNLVSETRVQLIGSLALVLPELGEGEFDCGLAWDGFEGWEVASSMGPGGQARSAVWTLDELRSCFVIAGAPGSLRVLTRPVRAGQIGLAVVDDDWGFTDEQLFDHVESVIEAERGFFDDYGDPWYLVALTPNGGRASGNGFSFGGTGLTDCFALYCNTGLDLSPGTVHTEQIQHLLAHEYFHNWNGVGFRLDGPEGSAYWFSEGFTEYYTRRLLRDSGLWDDGQWLENLNRSVALYDQSPAREAPNSRIIEAFWTDRDISDLPYRRGDLLALVLDQAIEKHSGSSLDDLMLWLHGREEAGLTPLAPDALFARIAELAGDQFAAVMQGCVEDGDPVPLPEEIGGGAYRLSEGRMTVSDDGFDVDASREAGAVVGLREGTGADRAGLENGDSLVLVERLPPVDGPGRLRVVTRGADGYERTVVFEAVSEPRIVRRYAPAGS